MYGTLFSPINIYIKEWVAKEIQREKKKTDQKEQKKRKKKRKEKKKQKKIVSFYLLKERKNNLIQQLITTIPAIPATLKSTNHKLLPLPQPPHHPHSPLKKKTYLNESYLVHLV